MNRENKVSWYIGTVMLAAITFACGMLTADHYISKDYTLTPKQTAFYMYVEKCNNCGSDMECEYSIISNVGFKGCAGCQSHYEYEVINEKEVIINGDN